MGEEDIVTTVLSEIISSKSMFHLNSHTGFSSTGSYNNEQNKGKVLLSRFISVVTIVHKGYNHHVQYHKQYPRKTLHNSIVGFHLRTQKVFSVKGTRQAFPGKISLR